VFGWSKARIGSDYCPIVLDSGETRNIRPRCFFFEDHWFQNNGFVNIIREKWDAACQDKNLDSYSLDTWHECLVGLRKYLRGWNLKLIGAQKEMEKKLEQRIKDIDLNAEHRLLSIMEWEERISTEEELENIYIAEETFWKQRAGTKWVLQGDTNSHFYHQFTNGRRRKNMIAFLNSDEGEIRGQREITLHIVNFYKKLFGPSEACFMHLGRDFWLEASKVTLAQQIDLIKPFEKGEIHNVVMELKDNSTSGPNGFGPGFFKKCWELYQPILIRMFHDFHTEVLDIKRLNYGVITLVPKLKEANTIKQYRPICLLNVDYKCFTKLLTNRLVPMAQKVIDKNQTGFIKDRNILEGVVVLHEVLHELKSSKKKGLILKLDFEKTYDRVR
jgi:hypothetical protein